MSLAGLVLGTGLLLQAGTPPQEAPIERRPPPPPVGAQAPKSTDDVQDAPAKKKQSGSQQAGRSRAGHRRADFRRSRLRRGW